eukprot:545383-Prorocentrum_minimum.AAC.1
MPAAEVVMRHYQLGIRTHGDAKVEIEAKVHRRPFPFAAAFQAERTEPLVLIGAVHSKPDPIRLVVS